MADIAAIKEALHSLGRPAGACALATVVMVHGSAYRRPGARMFVYPDGRRTGTVSGGCLEADVAERAREVLQTGAPEYVLYDTYGSNGDVVVELGCGGAVGVLIEPAASESACISLEFLASLGASRRRGALATVYRSQGPGAMRPGVRYFSQSAYGCEGLQLVGTMARSKSLSRDQRTGGREGLDAAGILADLVTAEFSAMQTDRAYFRTITIEDSHFEVLFESIVPQIALRVCGKGPDAFALAQSARTLGWSAEVAEEHPWHSDSEYNRRPANASSCSEQSIDNRTAVVIMTHNYARDLEWLRIAQESSAFYIGLLGPKHRTERLVNDLEHEFGPIGDAARARLHGPAGLDIGAETPEEIAMSIVAEIHATANQRAGGTLCSRTTSIHSISNETE